MGKVTVHPAVISLTSNIVHNVCRCITTFTAIIVLGFTSNSALAVTDQPVMPITEEGITSLVAEMQPKLPTVGQWMVDGKDNFASWLGEPYEGKPLREPINIIIIDAGANNEKDAVTRLVSASEKAGYPIRRGHSIGYKALICGEFYSEIPTGKSGAFSNEPFELDNNHGRIFGPCQFGDSFVFVAAFSRENIDPLGTPKHRYASFNRSRDDYSQRMNKTTAFQLNSFIDLKNTGLGTTWTTGDHDGMAVVLYAPKL